jgi:hypothetical protein
MLQGYQSQFCDSVPLINDCNQGKCATAQVEHNNLKTTKLSEARLLGSRNNSIPIRIKGMAGVWRVKYIGSIYHFILIIDRVHCQLLSTTHRSYKQNRFFFPP